MSKLNKSMPYAEVHGEAGGARYVQNGTAFDINGNELGEKERQEAATEAETPLRVPHNRGDEPRHQGQPSPRRKSVPHSRGDEPAEEPAGEPGELDPESQLALQL